ncbi:MAG: ORF6N domain-containing protein [Elusimicrobia bacterium]|nr:ORF6N domain-containing protein [Elusimicrobiota bacterium]
MNLPTRYDDIEHRILLIRGCRVMLDRDLAAIYGVSTKRLNEQVRRNRDRLPEDFMFQLTMLEATELLVSRSPIATLKRGQNVKYRPHVFTEHGAVMLASVLNSPIAVQASIQVVRVFIRLREMLAANKVLARRLDELESKCAYQFKSVFAVLRRLTALPWPLSPARGYSDGGDGSDSCRAARTSRPVRRNMLSWVTSA